jgi:hypothetical protein
MVRSVNDRKKNATTYPATTMIDGTSRVNS